MRPARNSTPAIDPPRAPQANSRTSDFGDSACKSVPFQNMTNAIGSQDQITPRKSPSVMGSRGPAHQPHTGQLNSEEEIRLMGQGLSRHYSDGLPVSLGVDKSRSRSSGQLSEKGFTATCEDADRLEWLNGRIGLKSTVEIRSDGRSLDSGRLTDTNPLSESI